MAELRPARKAGPRGIDTTATPLLPVASTIGLALSANLIGALTAWWVASRGASVAATIAAWAVIALLVLLAQERPQRWVGGGRLDNRGLLRVVLALTQFAVIAGLCRLSFLLPVAGVVVAAVHISRSGSWLWRPAVRSTALGTVALQALVVAGWVPSALPTGTSCVVALIVLALSAVGIGNLGLATARTERALRELAEADTRFRALVSHSSDAVTMLDAHGVFRYASPACSLVLGLPAEELTGTHLEALVDPGEQADTRRRREAASTGTRAATRWEVRGNTAAGRPRWLEISMRALGPGSGDALLVNLRDVTERHEEHRHLSALATLDTLTGLLNRGEFLARGSELTRTSGPERATALLFCDLDDFKPVNDEHGHAAGDDVLRMVAARLTNAVRQGDLVARIGGDEFALLMAAPTNAWDVRRTADRVRRAIREPVRLASGAEVSVGVSIGTVTIDAAVQDLETVLPQADELMYTDKAARAAPGGRRPR